jgi:pimeloyl-ACP methyl ester carboxylesterase
LPNGFASAESEGRVLRFICSGEGAPTVVVDQGQGLSIERSIERPVRLGWARVFKEIGATTSILMHDRAGLGSSDGPPRARGSLEMVRDLRAILSQARIAPPYVLVGHSIGEFNVRVFAAQYPNEVAGVVLVDSSHPDQMARMVEVLPPASPGEPPPLKLLRDGTDPTSSPEKIDFHRCAEQARVLKSFGVKPLVVVSQSPRALGAPGIPGPVWERIRSVWSELQGELLTLSANSRHVVADNAGHHIQLDEPQLVIDAIIEVVKAARTGVARSH